jgi:hypothetical protein
MTETTKTQTLTISSAKMRGSKGDEVEILHRLAEFAEANQSYLASLLTPELLDWAAERIYNDFTVNLFDEFSDREAKIVRLEAKLAEYERKERNSVVLSDEWTFVRKLDLAV